jgi:hypothetical protein
MRTNQRADGLVAGVQALLWLAPIIILATGGHGIPSPGSVSDPSHALAVIKASPDIAIVTTLMCRPRGRAPAGAGEQMRAMCHERTPDSAVSLIAGWVADGRSGRAGYVPWLFR